MSSAVSTYHLHEVAAEPVGCSDVGGMFGHHVLVVDTVIWDFGLGLIYRDNKDFHLDVRAGVVIRQGNQGEQKGPPWIAQSVPSS